MLTINMTKKFAYIGSLGFIGVITTEFGIIGILPQVAAAYDMTVDKAGVLLSAFALIIALTGPFMTLLFSGFDRKKIMLLSIGIFVITGVVSTFSPPFWLLLLVRILPAFLQPVYIASALSVAVSQGKPNEKNKLMGIVFNGVAIAMVTTVPFATYIASLFSWQYSFAIQAVVSLIAWIGIYWGLPKMPVQQKLSFGTQLNILKKPVFLISTGMNFFMITAWFATYSYFTVYLNQAKQLSFTTISYVMLLFGVVGVLANWLAGKMLDKSIPKTTAFFLSGTLLIPLLLYWVADNTWMLMMVVALWGFLYAPSFLNASTYMISSVPNSLEFANSLATSFGNLGVTLGTTLGGWVIATQGVAYTPWVSVVFGALAFLMMAWRYGLENSQTRRCLKSV